MLIYLEIIELNFCELNKNTRRNILKREIKEKMDLEYSDEEDDLKNSHFEISPGYLIYLDDNKD